MPEGGAGCTDDSDGEIKIMITYRSSVIMCFYDFSFGFGFGSACPVLIRFVKIRRV